MHQESNETLPLREPPDLLLVRQMVRQRAQELGFSTLNQTKNRHCCQRAGSTSLMAAVEASGLRPVLTGPGEGFA